MTRVARLLHLDDGEFPALRAQIEAQPMPRVGIPTTTRPPLPLGAPARSIAALAELRAADRAMGMRAPAAPDAPKQMTDWQRDAIFGLMRLHVRQARVYAGRYDSVATEVEALLAALAELAPFAAKAVSL